MSKLSPQMKIVAIVGGALVVIAVALKLLVLHPKHASEVIPVPVHPTGKASAQHRPARPAPDPNIPAALRRALAQSRVVVAVLAAPGTVDDQEAVKAAREGAKAAHAGFTVLDVSKESVAKALALKAPGLTDPSVLVVTRPGTVAVRIAGYADSESVAQAAADARR